MGSSFSSEDGSSSNSSSQIVMAASGSSSGLGDPTNGFGSNETKIETSSTAIHSTTSTTMAYSTIHNDTSNIPLNVLNEHDTGNGTTLGENLVTLFGLTIYPFPWPQIYTWLGIFSSTAMVIGCVLPYVPQYITILNNRNASGFSTYVCLTLLIANISRVAFWYGNRFELPLLVQACVQIVAQILLLELCVRTKRQNSIYKCRIYNLNPKQFWMWTDLTSYLIFILIFSSALGVAMYYLVDCIPFVESVGYFALVTESMLGVPQVIKNHTNKSIYGMSIMMVLFWLAGDTFKTVYYIINNVPFQFWLCGLSQITIDLIILLQVALYRQNAPMKVDVKSNGGESPKEVMFLS